MRFTFHVGMGKTGTTAIQHGLAQSGPELAAAGYSYAGMWAPWTGGEYDGSGPFHDLLRLSPARLREEADRCLLWAEGVAAETGARTILHSNEAFHAVPFFQRLSERAEVRLIAYVRAPALWLLSAYLQWGVAHKTNPGPVQPFPATGRRLMGQYKLIRTLREGVGDLLEMRAYPEGGDVLDDFGAAIGVRLRRPEGRPQSRPGPVEAMFRAAFNSGFADPVEPHAFNEAMPPLAGGRPPLAASERLRRLYDLSDMPLILAENAELVGWFERTGGLDLQAPPPPPEPLPAGEALADMTLGALVDLVASQGREIAGLKARLRRIESGVETGVEAP